ELAMLPFTAEHIRVTGVLVREPGAPPWRGARSRPVEAGPEAGEAPPDGAVEAAAEAPADGVAPAAETAATAETAEQPTAPALALRARDGSANSNINARCISRSPRS